MNRKKSISTSVAEKEKTERGKKTTNYQYIAVAHSDKVSLNSGNNQFRVKLDSIKSKSAS